MLNDIKKYTEANRQAWNKVMPAHQSAQQATLDRSFANPGYVIQEAPELLNAFKDVGIKDKDIIHLCCNNGSELLSLRNMGAGRCVGVDISDIAIIEAQQRADLFDINCQFVRSDIYELPESLMNSFDIVHISAGGIGWLPDLNQFYKVVSGLLRQGGLLLMHEMHPLSEILPFDDNDSAPPLQVVESYFQDEPIEEEASLDYVSKDFSQKQIQYWKVHTLSELITGAINNNLTITHLSEYDRDISAMHSRQAEQAIKVPLSLILIASKQ
ncbi:MAG: class I SAM-dependent methyltransferase [Alteromonadales bacterium]|nr:class I SAM-dependent methyltransferase [Alteromonadales bacterium]